MGSSLRITDRAIRRPLIRGLEGHVRIAIGDESPALAVWKNVQTNTAPAPIAKAFDNVANAKEAQSFRPRKSASLGSRVRRSCGNTWSGRGVGTSHLGATAT